MGFKWFKARLRMNRMPTHSSAVAGSYRIASFDAPRNELISNNINNNNNDNNNNDNNDNNNRRNYANKELRPEPERKVNTRPISMPSVSNPMVGVSGKDEALEFVSTYNNKIAQSSSNLTREGSEYDGESMYRGLGAGLPIPLVNQKLKLNSDENIGIKTPRGAQKMVNNNYRKKKGKAPAPKVHLNTSSTGSSENGSKQFLQFQDQRKTSQGSDIDV